MTPETVWIWLVEQVTENDMFAGLVGMSVVGALLMSLRRVPGAVRLILKRQCTVEMVVYNTDDAFHWFTVWLDGHPYAKRSRRLKISSRQTSSVPSTDDEEEDDANPGLHVAPGIGFHWFMHRGRPLLLEHTIDTENSKGTFLRESYEIRLLGRSQLLLRNLLAEAEAACRPDEATKVYVWQGTWWNNVARKAVRPASSIILPQGQLEAIFADASHFFDAEPWYAGRGVPYRRGYLFSGAPGTGKTSVALALAGHFKRPIYVLGLGAVLGDESLFSAFANTPANAILVIEDIDACRAGLKRTKGKEPKELLTTSGLLNCIDGIASSDGRLLIMTTNHPDRLDPALMRPGRVDRHEQFEALGREEARAMYRRFFPGDCAVNSAQFCESLPGPLPAADIQERLMSLSETATALGDSP